MKTMNDFRKLESLNKDRRLKKEISNITEGKPLGAILMYHQTIKQLTKMRTFKLITKGVLLYVTILVTLLYMMGIDSIYDNGYFFHGLILVLIPIGVCYKTISKEELEILTLNKYFNHLDEEFK